MTGKYTANLRKFDSQEVFRLIASKIKTRSFRYGPYHAVISKFPDGIEQAVAECKSLTNYITSDSVDPVAVEDTIELMEYIFAQTSELITSDVMLYRGRQRTF